MKENRDLLFSTEGPQRSTVSSKDKILMVALGLCSPDNYLLQSGYYKEFGLLILLTCRLCNGKLVPTNVQLYNFFWYNFLGCAELEMRY